MVQEGVDGVLERNRAAGESNNPTHEGAPLLVSQQTRAARASHAAATVQVKPSSTSRAAAIGALLRNTMAKPSQAVWPRRLVIGTRFHDIRNEPNRSRRVSGFHTPAALDELS